MIRLTSRQRGSALVGYSLVLATFVSVALGAMGALNDSSETVLITSGQKIGDPRASQEYLATSVLANPPDWAQPTSPTTEASTTTAAPTTAAPTTTTTAPTTTTAAPTTTTAAPTTTTAAPTTTTTAAPTTTTAAGGYDPVYVGPYSAGNSGKCLRPNSSGRIVQTTCSSTATNQIITNQVNASGQSQLLINGQCLGTQDGSTSNSTRVVTRTCSTTDMSMHWTRVGSTWVNVAANKCMDVEGSSTANGTQIIIYSCHGGSNQTFNSN